MMTPRNPTCKLEDEEYEVNFGGEEISNFHFLPSFLRESMALALAGNKFIP